MELIIAAILFFIAFGFGFKYFKNFKKLQLEGAPPTDFWNNKYIFEAIPSTFPTLGIFCTALGITIGIWHFDTQDIQGSMPDLLGGLKLAFIATMLGIIGLIVFQKWGGLIQNQIDLSNQSGNSLTPEQELLQTIANHLKESKESNEGMIKSLSELFQSNMVESLKSFQSSSVDLSIEIKDLKNRLLDKLNEGQESNKILLNGIDKSLIKLQSENKEFNEQSIKNSESIITAMTKNNAFIIEKFETFSDLLKKNNTEALVEVMKSVTESFNSQMNELIERLVKENFEELNHSVQSMNTWQQENKQIIIELTSNYRNLTNSFETTANTLSNVKDNVAELVGENSKLIELVDVMNQVLIEDNNFTAISTKLANTVDKIEENTQAFTETTNKLNDWVRTERDFKESADRLIVQLEQFKDFNSGVWVNYRKEMEAAVAIIEKTSQTISTNLENHNDHFYDSLASTFENLDTLIQRTIKKYE